MKYPAYPNYKPSGVEWLGDVPEHWEIRKFSREVRIAEGQVDPEAEPFASMFLIAPNHIESGTGRLLSKETAAEQGAESGKYLCRRGDVIYSKIRPALAKVTIAPDDCLCSADMYPLSGSQRFVNSYIRWLLLSQQFTAWSILESDRVAMPKINRETLSELRMSVPPLPEQLAISDFLDAQTTKLDTLVAKKRELIEKLKEKRTALISRTVTRGLPPDAARAAGLNPHPKLRPSRIEWLGEVSEHWSVTRLKFVVPRIEQGWSPNCHSHTANEEEWGVLKAGCCNNGRFNPDENKALPVDLEPLSELEIRPGDVLMSRASGSEELIGSTALVLPDCRPHLLLSDKTYRLRVDTSALVASYVAYLLQSLIGRFQIQKVISGAPGLAKNIAQSDVKNFVLPLPPMVEQRAIADYLDRETAKIDRMIEKVEAAIEKLQEYRTALITAAVTGKVDVRSDATQWEVA